jgi:hypothetical protein
MLRDGYRRGAVYLLMDVDSKYREIKERSIFGPKCFDFHNRLETHLLTRTVVIALSPDNSVDRSLDAEKKPSHLAGVRAWLAAEAAKAREVWVGEKVEDRWNSPEFRARVASMGGVVGRDHVVAATLLLVADIFGWDFDDAIQSTVGGRRRFEEQGEETEVAGMILDLTPGWRDETADPYYEITTDALLTALNDERKTMSQNPMSRYRLRDVLTDLGFVSETEKWHKATGGPNRNRWVIRPYSLLENLREAADMRRDVPELRSTEVAIESYGENEANAPHAPHAPQG